MVMDEDAPAGVVWPTSYVKYGITKIIARNLLVIFNRYPAPAKGILRRQGPADGEGFLSLFPMFRFRCAFFLAEFHNIR